MRTLMSLIPQSWFVLNVDGAGSGVVMNSISSSGAFKSSAFDIMLW